MIKWQTPFMDFSALIRQLLIEKTFTCEGCKITDSLIGKQAEFEH